MVRTLTIYTAHFRKAISSKVAIIPKICCGNIRPVLMALVNGGDLGWRQTLHTLRAPAWNWRSSEYRSLSSGLHLPLSVSISFFMSSLYVGLIVCLYICACPICPQNVSSPRLSVPVFLSLVSLNLPRVSSSVCVDVSVAVSCVFLYRCFHLCLFFSSFLVLKLFDFNLASLTDYDSTSSNVHLRLPSIDDSCNIIIIIAL